MLRPNSSRAESVLQTLPSVPVPAGYICGVGRPMQRERSIIHLTLACACTSDQRRQWRKTKTSKKYSGKGKRQKKNERASKKPAGAIPVLGLRVWETCDLGCPGSLDKRWRAGMRVTTLSSLPSGRRSVQSSSVSQTWPRATRHVARGFPSAHSAEDPPGARAPTNGKSKASRGRFVSRLQRVRRLSPGVGNAVPSSEWGWTTWGAAQLHAGTRQKKRSEARRVFWRLCQGAPIASDAMHTVLRGLHEFRTVTAWQSAAARPC